MDDRWDGLYLPPEHFSNGKPVDNGTILPPLALDARPDRADAVFASELPVRWVPGQAVTIRGQIRTTGHAPARLSVCGFDRLAGSETVSRPVTATEWTQVEITVTPSNPWIVVLVGASPALGKPAFAWFDAITVEAAQAQGSR